MRYLLNFSKRLITHLKHDEFIKLNIKEGQLFISNTRDGEEAYAFDTDGQLKSIKWFNPNSELIYFKGITYGSKGVTLEENYYQSLNGYQRILKSYDKHDNLVSEDLLVATNQSDWRLRKRTSFLTENNFLIKKEIDYNEDGNVKKFDERRLTKKIKKVTSENKCHLTLKKEETLKNGKTKCVVQNEHGKLEKILGARGELLKVTFYKVRSIIKNDFQALDVSYNKLFQFEYLYKANRLVVEIAIDFSNEKDLVFYKKKFLEISEAKLPFFFHYVIFPSKSRRNAYSLATSLNDSNLPEAPP